MMTSDGAVHWMQLMGEFFDGSREGSLSKSVRCWLLTTLHFLVCVRGCKICSFSICVLAPWWAHMNLIWTNTMWVAICCFCEASILGSLNLTIDDFYFLLCKRCISFRHQWELAESKVLRVTASFSSAPSQKQQRPWRKPMKRQRQRQQ